MRGSARIKRRREREERGDEGMWSCKIAAVKMTSTTTGNCSGKNTSANNENRIAGEPPAFRGKPRFCEKNTVKRRKEKNDGEKTETTVSPGGQE